MKEKNGQTRAQRKTGRNFKAPPNTPPEPVKKKLNRLPAAELSQLIRHLEEHHHQLSARYRQAVSRQ